MKALSLPRSSKLTLSGLALAAVTTVLSAAPAQAQSTEEVLGTVLGGSLGAVVGNEFGKGGDVVGGLLGGSLGYYVGEQLNTRNQQRQYPYAQPTYTQQPTYQQQPTYSQSYPSYGAQQTQAGYSTYPAQPYGGRVVYQSPHIVTQVPQPYYHSQPSYSAPQPVYREVQPAYSSQPRYIQTHQPTYRR